MAEYNLTPRQRELLKTIVEQVKSGKVQEPLIPVVSNSGSTLIGIKGDFGRNLLGDLKVLSEADLLGFHFTSQGKPVRPSFLYHDATPLSLRSVGQVPALGVCAA